MSKKFYFNQFSISAQFISVWPIDSTLPDARVDQGAMAIKRYSAFPKAPALLKTYYQNFSVISRTLVSGDLPLAEMQSVYSADPANWKIQRISLTLETRYCNTRCVSFQATSSVKHGDQNSSRIDRMRFSILSFPGFVVGDPWVVYVIRYQNTGTWSGVEHTHKK